MKYFKDVTAIKKTFFEKKMYYKRMKNVTQEKIDEIIDKMIPEFEEFFKEHNKSMYFYDSRGSHYLDCIQYLLYNFKCKELTYDEKVLFLILCCDPECKILDNYENTEIMSKDEILDAELPDREFLNDKRNSQIEGFKSRCRSDVGFFDTDIISFERDYVNKILKKTDFNTKINKDYTSNLLNMFKDDSFIKISDTDFKRVSDTAMFYLSSVSNNTSAITSNAILFQNDILKLRNNAERFIFFILVIDPELDAYKIYEDHCNMKKMKPVFIERFGFYEPLLIQIEKKYHELYCPDMFISEWTIKKDL